MASSSPETVLQRAAQDGVLETDDWPKTLKFVLDRLDHIVNDFPRPPTPPDDPLPSNSNTPSRPQPVLSSQESQTADKENAPPATPPRPPVPAFAGTPPASLSDSQGLPQETINFYSSIRTALSKNFAKNPPHTIQRLAELILEPKRRYRFLSSYLRALDRVVSVSSPSTIFPLPIAVLPTSGGLLNGTAPTTPSTLGSDESLGGALLTPIPWLQSRGSQSELISESTEMVQGPNGAGRIETVSVINGTNPAPVPSSTAAQIASSHPEGETLPNTGAVTQGELLRQEQEAGVVLSNPHSMNPNRAAMGEMEGGGSIVETVEGEEEVPHARGPEVIGMEDTGPQRGSGGTLDIEGAVGRPSLEGSNKSPGPATAIKAGGEVEDEEMKDGSGADGKSGADEGEEETQNAQKVEKDEDMEAD